MLNGFTGPYTPSGNSSLVPAPPWHYAGTCLSAAFRTNAAAAQSLLPDGLGRATGTAYANFWDWQATTDGSELLDPVRAQYKELVILIEAESPDGTSKALFCAMIWVDQDTSLVRGLLQGLPKKFGSIWLTRSWDLDHPAAAPRRSGTRLGASATVKDRRIAELQITLSGREAAPAGSRAMPVYSLLAAPTLLDTPKRGEPRMVRTLSINRMSGPLAHGTGTLELFDSPHDEVAILAPTGPVEATYGAFAFTIVGSEIARPW